MFFVVVIKLTYVWYSLILNLLRNMTVLESMTYNKRLLSYVGKFIKKWKSSTSPNTECNGKSDGIVFQTLFPCAVESETISQLCQSMAEGSHTLSLSPCSQFTFSCAM